MRLKRRGRRWIAREREPSYRNFCAPRPRPIEGVEVHAWQNPFEMIEAHAQILDDGSVRLDTRNVASLTLRPPREFVRADYAGRA